MRLDKKANTFNLPPYMIIPIAARDEEDIVKYVGPIEEISRYTPNKAFLVRYEGPIVPKDPTVRILDLPESDVLHAQKQVWVHYRYTGYRRAYIRLLTDADLGSNVIDHIMNRKFAHQLGYNYIRLCPVSRAVNTSSGRGPETEAVRFQGTPKGAEVRDSSRVMYADPADIIKMLNIKTGHFPLDGVRKYLKMMYSLRMNNHRKDA